MTTKLSDAGVQFADASIQLGAANTPIPFTAVASAGVLTITVTATTAVAMQNSGTVVRANVASGLNLVVPALASLGMNTSQPGRILVMYSATNNCLMVANIAGGNAYDESSNFAPVVISTGATAANIAYSASGTTSSPYKIIGYVDLTWTSGTGWATPSNVVCVSTAMPLAAMSSLGYGQTWQDVTVSRALGTTYYNTTGRPIRINVRCGLAIGGSAFSITVNGLQTAYVSAAGNCNDTLSTIVPIGVSYLVTNISGATLGFWAELR